MSVNGSGKGRWNLGIGAPEAMWRAVSAPKLHLRSGEEGLCSPRSRLKDNAGLFDRTSQAPSSLWGIILSETVQQVFMRICLPDTDLSHRV